MLPTVANPATDRNKRSTSSSASALTARDEHAVRNGRTGRTSSTNPSGCLDEPDDVAVGVGHRCHQPAAADILDRLILHGAGRQQTCDALVDAVDVPVTDRDGHAAGVTVGI